MAKVYRSHFGSSCIILPHPPTPIPVSREEAWRVYPSSASTPDSSEGRGPGLGGARCPRKHVPPPQNFPGRCRGFPLLVLVTRGFFSPLAFFPLLDLYLFRDKGGKGDPPLFETPLYVPGTNPTPFERLGMRDLRPPLGSTCTKVGLLLQGCTIVVAATHGGGAAAP